MDEVRLKSSKIVNSVSYKEIQFYTLYFIIGNENKHHVYHITYKGNLLLYNKARHYLRRNHIMYIILL